MARDKWRPRRTLIDLYWEKDQTKRYWRLTAVIASFFILAGFIICPVAFEDDPRLTTKRGAVTVATILLLAAGYSLSIMLFVVCKSHLFRFDVILIPCLTSNLLGFLNIIYNVSIRAGLPWTALTITVTVISLGSATIYSILALIMFHKISTVRKRDALHRRPSSWQEDSSKLLSEEDAQRQQLLRLLRKSKEDRAPSPGAQSTYRIDLPESMNVARHSDVYHQLPAPTQLATPDTVYEGRSRSQPPPRVEQSGWTPQTPGSYAGSWSASSLSRDPSYSSREQRRQEIEMNNQQYLQPYTTPRP